MKCMDRKHSALASWDQSHYAYEFEQFENIPTKTNFNFIHLLPNPIVYEQLSDLVVFQVEFPNCLVGGNPNLIDVFKYDHKIKKIITNCPFTVEYFNKFFGYDKLEFGFSPFNKRYIPLHGEKPYDVYYTGHSYNSVIRSAFPILEKFKACFVCEDYGDNRNIGYIDKLALNAKSKISVVHGLLHWPVQFRKNVENFKGHDAFYLVNETGLVPQMKTRIMEAAASKSVILCLQDSWNMIESYFVEGRDFLYWTDHKDLEEKINYILSHYDEFVPMVESAYNTLINNFTTEHFFDKYLRNL